MACSKPEPLNPLGPRAPSGGARTYSNERSPQPPPAGEGMKERRTTSHTPLRQTKGKCNKKGASGDALPQAHYARSLVTEAHHLSRSYPRTPSSESHWRLAEARERRRKAVASAPPSEMALPDSQQAQNGAASNPRYPGFQSTVRTDALAWLASRARRSRVRCYSASSRFDHSSRVHGPPVIVQPAADTSNCAIFVTVPPASSATANS